MLVVHSMVPMTFAHTRRSLSHDIVSWPPPCVFSPLTRLDLDHELLRGVHFRCIARHGDEGIEERGKRATLCPACPRGAVVVVLFGCVLSPSCLVNCSTVAPGRGWKIGKPKGRRDWPTRTERGEHSHLSIPIMQQFLRAIGVMTATGNAALKLNRIHYLRPTRQEVAQAANTNHS